MTHRRACGLYKEIQRGGKGEADQRSEPEYNQHLEKRYMGVRQKGKWGVLEQDTMDN